MKKLNFTLFFIGYSLVWSFAQTDQSRINQLDVVGAGGHNTMIGKAMPSPEVIGSTYYSDRWLEGYVLFNNGNKLDNVALKLELMFAKVEVRRDNNVIAYNGRNVKEFQWFNAYSNVNSVFENCHGYKTDNTELDGFFEIMVEDDISLFAYPKIKVKKPDYVEGLDVGNKDYKIMKVEQYYLVSDNTLLDLDKKKNIRQLKSSIPELKTFLKTNNFSFKQRDDLIQITIFLNSLNASIL